MMPLLRVMLSAFLVMALAAALTSCGGGRSASVGTEELAAETAAATAAPETTASVSSQRVALAKAKPMDAYVLMGRQIKTCWFNAEHPLLPEHVYRADVSPDGSKVQITLHDRRNLGRAGMSTYAVDFVQEGAYTVITTQNRKMSPEIDAKLRYDINRWKMGETSCSRDMPKVTAAPPPKQQ
jgi:hypothetical protein